MINLVSIDDDLKIKEYTKADLYDLYRCSCGIMAISRVMSSAERTEHFDTEVLNDIDEEASIFSLLAMLAHPITQFFEEADKYFPEGKHLEPTKAKEEGNEA